MDFNVLMLNEIRDFGGGEVLTLDMTKGLIDEGISVTLGCNRDSVLERKAREMDIPVISFPMRNEMDFFATLYIISLIEKHKFNIIHCHTMRDHVLGGAGGKFSQKVKVVRSQHIHYPENPSILAQLAYKKWTDLILCNSLFIKENLKKEGIPEDLLDVLHNGVDLKKLQNQMNLEEGEEDLRTELNLDKDALLIGCVGSLFETKGQAILIESFSAISQDIPQSRLIITGSGPTLPQLQKQAEDLGIKEKVFFLGKRKNVYSIYPQLDFFVVPSLWEEPFGLVNVEAMFFGVPVIASRGGGIPEIMEDKKSGLLVPKGDPSAITQAILSLYKNPCLKNSIIRCAQKTVKDKFGIEIMIKKLLYFYDKLLS